MPTILKNMLVKRDDNRMPLQYCSGILIDLTMEIGLF
jgi:hypothetical protein